MVVQQHWRVLLLLSKVEAALRNSGGGNSYHGTASGNSHLDSKPAQGTKVRGYNLPAATGSNGSGGH